MRHRIAILALAVAIAAALGGCATTYYDQSPATESYDDADYGYFYDALSPYGAWYNVSPYGWCWTPYDVPVGWHPYTDGEWVYTDWGWTWLADEPWGWAPYHYGRWTYDHYYGWIWVPGNIWAPAWVAWRYGDGWVGWAPLPPDVGWQVGVGLDFGSYDLDRDLGPYRWSFCREADFTTTRVRTVVIPRSRNVTLLRTTRNVTRYADRDSRAAERGFTATVLENDLKRKIPRYDLSDAQAVGRDRPSVIRGNVVEVYRPTVRDRAPTETRERPDVGNRPGEQQRLDERNRARTEARAKRNQQNQQGQTQPPVNPPGRSQIEQPGEQRQRAKVEATPPAAKPEPPPAETKADQQRQEAERRSLEEQIRTQRQELKKEQQSELKQPPPGVSREELQRRHEEELKAQQEVEKRDREQLQNREELQRQWREQRAQEQQKQREEQQQKQQEKQKERQDQQDRRDQGQQDKRDRQDQQDQQNQNRQRDR
ncbi:MAG TPA: DUF6600 domain-containing protein [Candidatus Eisenbacteria bacterium]